ncbi:MAG: hypothetical protein RLZZ09_815 [Pseudomonadota bacterium]|jgi:hypothetical protein
MSRGLSLTDLPFWPAAMTQQQAAAYCGLSVDTFKERCPVVPVVITASSHGKRYLRTRLDEWLHSLETPAPRRHGMGARLRGESAHQGS